MTGTLTLLGGVLAAIVTYVAPDGVYLDEGADDGVRVGDVVVIGKQRLVVETVAPSQSRTGAPPDVFAIRIGAKAVVTPTGEKKTVVDPGPRKPPPPSVEAEIAAAWWPGASDGWVEPRPLPEEGSTRPEKEDEGIVWGTLSVDGHVYHQDEMTWNAAARSRLGVDAEPYWYRHDVRFNLDQNGGRWAEPPVEVRQLEAGYRTEGWGLQAGRMFLADPLAAAALDGAAFGLHDVGPDRIRIFAGVAPEAVELLPEIRNPQAGVAVDTDFGDPEGLAGTFAATALVSGFDGGLDRMALAPELRLRHDRFRIFARAEFDAYATAPEGRSSVEATRLYGRLRVELFDDFDATVRYDRYRPPALPSLAAQGFAISNIARQSLGADLRYDIGRWGVARLTGTLMDGEHGLILVPGMNYWLALTDYLDLSATAHYRDSVYERFIYGRVGAVFRFNSPWPMSLDLATRVTDMTLLDRDELSSTHLTGEVGLWTATPAGFDLRIAAERDIGLVSPAEAVPVTLVFADVRWRFGR